MYPIITVYTKVKHSYTILGVNLKTCEMWKPGDETNIPVNFHQKIWCVSHLGSVIFGWWDSWEYISRCSDVCDSSSLWVPWTTGYDYLVCCFAHMFYNYISYPQHTTKRM